MDTEALYYFGGSHGGFLGAHLALRDARLQAVALVNPVTDVATMYATSDIPDWCYVECGLAEHAASVDALATAFRASPAAHLATGHAAPTLLLVGDSDRRVPPSQAFALYHALRAKGTPTRYIGPRATVWLSALGYCSTRESRTTLRRQSTWPTICLTRCSGSRRTRRNKILAIVTRSPSTVQARH